MLPDPDGLRSGVEFFARRQGRAVQIDARAFADAIAHAGRLAGVDERAEPAALFFACAWRSRMFAGAAQQAVPFIAAAHAHRLGLELVVKDIELDVLRARILYGAMEFAELRAWFSARLRLLPPR